MALIPLISAPGIQRDGTILASQACTDGLWTRWQRGLPRKMGGYRNTQPYLTAISRQLLSQAYSGNRFIYSGTPVGIDQFTIDSTNVASAVTNPRFPATVYPTTAGLPTTGVNGQPYTQVNAWQLDVCYDNFSNQNLLFAVCNQTQLDTANQGLFPLYCTYAYNPAAWTFGTSGPIPGTSGTYGPQAGFIQVAGYGTGTDGHGGTLQALFPNGVSGLVSVAPYLFVYGNDGFVAWSTPGYPTDFTGASLGSLYVGATRITAQKIIKGFNLRGGGGYSPNALFFSIDSLIRATFVGVPNGTWQFDQLTTDISVLSDDSIVEDNGTYYWAGVDHFYMFNGSVQEIPNSQNLNYFYDNINTTYAAKSFAFKVTRYGEIWWCYPRGSSTECSHAVIYNYREKYWYDTPLPDLRSAGIYGDNFIGTIMAGASPYTYQSLNGSGVPATYTAYNLWQHEQGTDQVFINGANVAAVESYFTTAPISALTGQQPVDVMTSLEQLKPDFIQTGNLTVTVLKQNNANAPVTLGSTQIVAEPDPVASINQVVPLKDTAKILRLKIDSNVLGGNYQTGRCLLTVDQDGGRDT